MIEKVQVLYSLKVIMHQKFDCAIIVQFGNESYVKDQMSRDVFYKKIDQKAEGELV